MATGRAEGASEAAQESTPVAPATRVRAYDFVHIRLHDGAGAYHHGRVHEAASGHKGGQTYIRPCRVIETY